MPGQDQKQKPTFTTCSSLFDTRDTDSRDAILCMVILQPMIPEMDERSDSAHSAFGPTPSTAVNSTPSGSAIVAAAGSGSLVRLWRAGENQLYCTPTRILIPAHMCHHCMRSRTNQNEQSTLGPPIRTLHWRFGARGLALAPPQHGRADTQGRGPRIAGAHIHTRNTTKYTQMMLKSKNLSMYASFCMHS